MINFQMRQIIWCANRLVSRKRVYSFSFSSMGWHYRGTFNGEGGGGGRGGW